MKVIYNFARYLPSFNFFEWLVQVKTLGATCILFDARWTRYLKWSVAHTLERIRSICYDGAALAGLPYEIVIDESQLAGARDPARPGGGHLVAFWNQHGRIERLRSPRAPRPCEYTVTLRKTQRSPTRDSREEDWRAFADQIGALVIPDYDEAPIHLHERMALYAGARMNFFVSNGPGVLCSLTEYPCMMFNTHHARGSLASDGVGGWGAQYPWMLADRQRAIWVEDTYENIWEHFDHWLNTGGFLDNPAEPAAA